MKINGMKLEGPNIVTLVLPREYGDIVIRAQAVLDYKKFEALCPRPTPPMKIARGTGKVPDFDDRFYIGEISTYGAKKTAFMFLESLKATPGLEWETVSMTEPSTWANYEEELSSAGFSDVERQRILQAVIDANCLNETRLEEARERFLKGQVVAIASGHSSSEPSKDEPTFMPSTEPANASESVPQELQTAGTT